MKTMNQIQANIDLSSINRKSVERAARSLTGLPFKKAFFAAVNKKAMSASELCIHKNRENYILRPINPQKCEGYFIWLIRLGVLRREVDGQGLTNRIKLTAMGRSVISEWKNEIPRAGVIRQILEKTKRILNQG